MSELNTIYSELSSNNEISLQTLQATIRQLVKNAYRIAYGSADNCVVCVDDSLIEIFEIKTVVEEEYSERLEIELPVAKLINPDCEVGDQLKIYFDESLLSSRDILKATSEVYRKTNDEEKKFIISYIQSRLEGFDLYSTEPSKGQPSTAKLVPYYESYKPFHHPEAVTPTEKELDEKYEDGFYDAGPNPFPFSPFDSEDDYGEDSWS